MKSLISIYTDEDFVNALEVACKAINSQKATHIVTLKKVNCISPGMADWCKNEVSKLDEAYNELFEMYMSLSSGLQ